MQLSHPRAFYQHSPRVISARRIDFLGSAARQRLLAIASAFDLRGAPIEKWSSSTSLVRKRSMRLNRRPAPGDAADGGGRQKVWRTSTHPVRSRTQSQDVVS